jgi:hypothetical protein
MNTDQVILKTDSKRNDWCMTERNALNGDGLQSEKYHSFHKINKCQNVHSFTSRILNLVNE